MGECKRDDMRNMIFNVRLQNIDNGSTFHLKTLKNSHLAIYSLLDSFLIYTINNVLAI